ncbi:MAG TPA: hypothetical protein VNZ86_09425 [Bacteroidia bacterium]|jgi:hypothetical protein|nr:hypothetical protein [Bacteroidia bacterium]
MFKAGFFKKNIRFNGVAGIRLSAVIATFLVSALFLPSCKKDRAPSPTPPPATPPTVPVLGYTAPTTFYNTYKQPVQVFQVDSPGTGPIVGAMGTKLYPTDNIFMYPSGQNVYYPFTLQLIEEYPVKDIILSNMPTVAGGRIMQAKPVISARAFKGTTELVLKPGKKLNMQTATISNMLTGNSVYYGFPSGTINDWTSNVTTLDPTITHDTLSSVTNVGSTYSMNIARMGWVTPGQLFTAGSTTSITFTCTGNTPQNINVFLIFNNDNSVMQVYSLVSGQVPIGTSLTMVAIAYDANNKLVYDKQSLTVTNGMTVALNPIVTTEANLLSVLGAL